MKSDVIQKQFHPQFQKQKAVVLFLFFSPRKQRGFRTAHTYTFQVGAMMK